MAAAKAMMEKSDQLLSHSPTIDKYRAVHMAYHVLFALYQNDLEDAVSWGKRLSEQDCTPWVAQLWVPARLLIALGEKAAASAQLEGLCQMAIREGAHGLVISIRVCQALAEDTPGRALPFLSEALTLGESEGFIRTFVDEGRFLKPLLRKALVQGITPEYTASLLAIIDSEERLRQAKDAKRVQAPTSPEFLSQRELEVLRLVADGLSNGQIAGKLVISLNTAKRHVHNISGKLNSNSRTGIVAQARKMKLI
jgi:LuxR family maltose regulon positive regulatory protein